MAQIATKSWIAAQSALGGVGIPSGWAGDNQCPRRSDIVAQSGFSVGTQTGITPATQYGTLQCVQQPDISWINPTQNYIFTVNGRDDNVSTYVYLDPVGAPANFQIPVISKLNNNDHNYNVSPDNYSSGWLSVVKNSTGFQGQFTNNLLALPRTGVITAKQDGSNFERTVTAIQSGIPSEYIKIQNSATDPSQTFYVAQHGAGNMFYVISLINGGTANGGFQISYTPNYMYGTYDIGYGSGTFGMNFVFSMTQNNTGSPRNMQIKVTQNYGGEISILNVIQAA